MEWEIGLRAMYNGWPFHSTDFLCVCYDLYEVAKLSCPQESGERNTLLELLKVLALCHSVIPGREGGEHLLQMKKRW